MKPQPGATFHKFAGLHLTVSGISYLWGILFDPFFIQAADVFLFTGCFFLGLTYLDIHRDRN